VLHLELYQSILVACIPWYALAPRPDRWIPPYLFSSRVACMTPSSLEGIAHRDANLGFQCLDRRFVTPALSGVFEERLRGARVRTRSAAAMEVWDEIGAEGLMGEMQEMQGGYVSVRYCYDSL
jgi:hypothetical protein